MNLLALITDNVTEMLVRVMEFTQIRQKILTHNIQDMHKAGFVPRDLAVQQFSEAMNTAIEEHLQHNRLVLCDGDSIKFGSDGRLVAHPVSDHLGEQLLTDDPDQYLELQIDRLLENSLNQRIAAELLRQRHQAVMIC
jgi:flagellar basal body rod protein FlgB